MNLSEKTKITGMEKNGCTFGHIAHQLNRITAKYKYSYFGKRVQRGTVTIQTKNGPFSAKFRAENFWITELNFF